MVGFSQPPGEFETEVHETVTVEFQIGAIRHQAGVSCTPRSTNLTRPPSVAPPRGDTLIERVMKPAVTSSR
jgi:hypothetical protein